MTGPLTLEELAREGAVLAGAGAAILLQVAHRPVAAGVAAHSDFTRDPMRRLRHTLQYIYAVSLPEARPVRQQVLAAVGRAHGPVHGVDADGQRYSAGDPEAQLWVAATLYWTAEQVRSRLWGALDSAVADQLYRESAVLGTALGMPAEAWPTDRDAFRQWWQQRLATLEVTDAARQIAADLFAAEHAPVWMRALMPVAQPVTAELLPAGVRHDLGLELDVADTVRIEQWWAAVRSLYPRLPSPVRHAPASWILRGLGV